MLIKRLYEEQLAQASWLVGCDATGEALVVDPNRDVGRYLEAARQEGLRITHVAETHIHADFVSGVRELVRRAGARAHLSGAGGEEWRYGFAGELGADLVVDGSRFEVGRVLVEVRHTPGHTPEHVCFLATDLEAADLPVGAFTGDFIFAGDVGRPDLLEKVAGVAGVMESSARALYASLQRFKALPDWLQLWPGHGAGSACGKSLGAMPQTTLGYERLFNWGLAAASEREFLEGVLQGQPEPPRYFGEMKRVNRDGPRSLGSIAAPVERSPRELGSSGALLVDTRSWRQFRAGHVPGSVSIPLNRSFTTYAGSVLPYDRDLWLLAADFGFAVAAARNLALIGVDRITGYFEAAALAGYAAERPLGSMSEVDAPTALRLMAAGEALALDVRDRSEWEEVRLGAAPVRHLPLKELPEQVPDLPRGRPVLVYCKSGSRSAIAASILAAQGFQGALNVRGGLDAWESAGGAVERGTAG